MATLKIDELNIRSFKFDEVNIKELKMDEIHTDLSLWDELNIYEPADKAIKFLNRYSAKKFTEAQDTINDKFDELKVYSTAKTLYNTLYNADRKVYLAMAKGQYRRFGGSEEPDLAWLLLWLDEIDEVTQYSFKKELVRKRDRFAENVIATKGMGKEFRKGLKYFSDMTKQYADTIAYEAMIKSFKDQGYKKVMWVTEKDERVCGECSPMHGKIYDIDKIPRKKHWRCRCYVIPIS